MWITFLAAALAANAAFAQVPTLPAGTDTHWTVKEPQEIVAYVLFDPAAVDGRLPPTLRFITVGELAAQGLQWATEHLAQYPSHDTWGISFLEIVRMGLFDIDGRHPDWPEHGASAAFCSIRSSSSLPALEECGRACFPIRRLQMSGVSCRI